MVARRAGRHVCRPRQPSGFGGDQLGMLAQSLEEVRKNFVGLVIGNQGPHFSAGANILMLLTQIQNEDWDEVDQSIRLFQKSTSTLRQFEKPVVSACHGYTLEELFARRFTPAFREVMRETVGKARELFRIGLPLSGMVDRRLAVDLDLFSRGGLRVLEKIEAQDYNVLSSRPAISKAERVRLLLASLARIAFRTRAA